MPDGADNRDAAEKRTAPLPRFRLNPLLDAGRFRAAYAADGRVQIPDVLTPECAAALHAELRGRDDWRQVVNSGGNVFQLDRAARAAMTREQADALDEAVFAGARDGFQYRYEAIRVPDEAEARAASDDPLAAFAAFLSGGEAREFLRAVTGRDEISFADAQATAYSPGDFLTAHDDDVPGKGRIAAYVLGLTPLWRLEWGGLLLFHDAEGHAGHGLAPRFNTLNLFAVPQLHSVSIVSRAAAFRRYSVTGWLRRS